MSTAKGAEICIHLRQKVQKLTFLSTKKGAVFMSAMKGAETLIYFYDKRLRHLLILMRVSGLYRPLTPQYWSTAGPHTDFCSLVSF